MIRSLMLNRPALIAQIMRRKIDTLMEMAPWSVARRFAHFTDFK
jgi:hypothetical protein